MRDIMQLTPIIKKQEPDTNVSMEEANKLVNSVLEGYKKTHEELKTLVADIKEVKKETEQTDQEQKQIEEGSNDAD